MINYWTMSWYMRLEVGGWEEKLEKQLLIRLLKIMKKHYARAKNHLMVYYDWYWCKLRELFDYEEED